MSVHEPRGFCKTCGEKVLIRRQGANHILHLLLTVLTLGVWGWVWLFVALGKVGGWRCTRCGRRVRKSLFG
jgi:DNA-directed RNA polymerase subunit RPC12/RpoP